MSLINLYKTKLKVEQQEKEFGIIDSMLNHIRKIFDHQEKNGQEYIDDTIVSLGRTEEEREQLKEMCEEEDLYEKRLAELRKSNLQPGEWLNKFIDEELESSCESISKEAKEMVKQMVMDETGKSITAQIESLDDEMEQTSDIAHSIKSIRGGEK